MSEALPRGGRLDRREAVTSGEGGTAIPPQPTTQLETVRRITLAAEPEVPTRRYPWIDAIIGIIRIATMLAILIIGLIAGPAVSL
jgi:hypothetical protein